MRRIRIETGARLHFGLLATRAPFGGLGAMIDRPATVIECSTASSFSCDPAIKQRAYPIAERLCRFLGLKSLPGVRVEAMRTAPSHCGLGSGTQISMAIAEGLCRFVGEELPLETIAVEIADRAKRSAVGVHGYQQGGLIFESTPDEATTTTRLNPVVQRVDVPEDWRVVLFLPVDNDQSVSGEHEQGHFDALDCDSDTRQILKKRIEVDLLPAAQQGDFPAFASAIESYNHDSGMLYEAVQGGAYNGKAVEELVDQIRARGGVGVGQSSWGPGVFSWCADADAAVELVSRFENVALEALIVRVRRQGRSVSVDPSNAESTDR